MKLSWWTHKNAWYFSYQCTCSARDSDGRNPQCKCYNICNGRLFLAWILCKCYSNWVEGIIRALRLVVLVRVVDTRVAEEGSDEGWWREEDKKPVYDFSCGTQLNHTSEKGQSKGSCKQESKGKNGETILILPHLQSGPIDKWMYFVLKTFKFP